MADRIARALDLTSEEALIAQTGTSVKSHESIPAAFGLLRLNGGAVWPALLAAANIGDDTDTVGAIIGANDLHAIDGLAEALVALRHRNPQAPV